MFPFVFVKFLNLFIFLSDFARFVIWFVIPVLLISPSIFTSFLRFTLLPSIVIGLGVDFDTDKILNF